MRHVRRHQSEFVNFEFGEILRVVTSSADRDHPALAFGERTFDIKANELYLFVFSNAK